MAVALTNGIINASTYAPSTVSKTQDQSGELFGKTIPLQSPGLTFDSPDAFKLMNYTGVPSFDIYSVSVEQLQGKEADSTSEKLSKGIEDLTTGNADVKVGEEVQKFVHGKVVNFSNSIRERENSDEKIETWNNWGDDFLGALAKDLGISEEDIKKLSQQEKEKLLEKIQGNTKAIWKDSLFGPNTLVSFVKKVGGTDKFKKEYQSDFKSSEWGAISNYYAPADMKPEDVRRIYSKTTMEIGSDVNLDALKDLVSKLNTTTPPKFAIVDGKLIAYGELTKDEILGFSKLFTSKESKSAFEQFVQNAQNNAKTPATPTDAFENGKYSPSSPLSVAEISAGSYSPAQARILGMMIAKVKSEYRQDAIKAILSRGILPKLEALEKEIQKETPGYKLNIISGYRDFAYNKRVGGAKGSKHMDGIAVDVSIPKGIGQEKFIKIATEAVGFTGIGRYSSFTHIDLGPKRNWNG